MNLEQDEAAREEFFRLWEAVLKPMVTGHFKIDYDLENRIYLVCWQSYLTGLRVVKSPTPK